MKEKKCVNFKRGLYVGEEREAKRKFFLSTIVADAVMIGRV